MLALVEGERKQKFRLLWLHASLGAKKKNLSFEEKKRALTLAHNSSFSIN